jgi:hypothetical protein
MSGRDDTTFTVSSSRALFFALEELELEHAAAQTAMTATITHPILRMFTGRPL